MAPNSETPDAKRELRLVEDVVEQPAGPVADAAPAPAPEPALRTAAPEPSSTSWFTWLLIGATLLFAWLWLMQVEKSNGLAADLAGVRSELTAARTDIVAWEVHGASVREGVEGIVSQLSALQALVSAVPTAGTEVAPEPAAGAPSAAAAEASETAAELEEDAGWVE